MAEESKPALVVSAQEQMSYRSLLLWAVNDVRASLQRAWGYVGAFDALCAILTDEVKGAVNPSLELLSNEFEKAIKKLKKDCQDEDGYLYEDEYRSRYKSLLRKSYLKRLAVVITALDEHGQLRKIRTEEVGGL